LLEKEVLKHIMTVHSLFVPFWYEELLGLFIL